MSVRRCEACRSGAPDPEGKHWTDTPRGRAWLPCRNNASARAEYAGLIEAAIAEKSSTVATDAKRPSKNAHAD